MVVQAYACTKKTIFEVKINFARFNADIAHSSAALAAGVVAEQVCSKDVLTGRTLPVDVLARAPDGDELLLLGWPSALRSSSLLISNL